MTSIVADANVALKWFRSAREGEVAEARALVTSERLSIRVPDLAYLEVGNALIAKLRVKATTAAAVLRRLRMITGTPFRLGLGDLAVAARLAERHELSLYDASYWAGARRLGATLVTMDSDLLVAGAGVTPARLCERLGLEVGDG